MTQHGHRPGRTQTAAVGVEPADRASIRRTNLGLILRHLRKNGGRSRTDLAHDTGLPKATISSLIAELVDRGLVREGDFERAGAVGRPRQSVDLDGRTIVGIGIEINVDYVSAVALDLRGTVAADHRVAVDVLGLGPDRVLDATADLIRTTTQTLRKRGIHPVAVHIAVPGVINSESGVAILATNIGWHNVRVVDGLRERLGPEIPHLQLENDAKAGAIAEYSVAAAAGIHDLLYVTGEVGVGGGIIADGQLLRGTAGYAGEIGHLPLDPEMRLCACGRRGCWETMVGLAALLRNAADPQDPVHDPSRDLEDRLAELRGRAEAGDERTLAALARIADGLGVGTSILVDVLNPQAVVLGGYFAFFGDYLADTVRATLGERVLVPGGNCEVLLSTLGFTSAARGAAHQALEIVFQDPGTVVGSVGA